MAEYYMKGMTVPIPFEEGPVVIRKGKTVEYETERVYSADTKDSRVKRMVIGKVDPSNPSRMTPNEKFFQLFPESSMPEAERDAFLRECRRAFGLLFLRGCDGTRGDSPLCS